MTRVTAPSRLHFGLFNVPGPGDPPGDRRFGGVGLMVDAPGLAVAARPADDWSAAGPLAGRALAFAKAFVDSLPTDERRPFAVTVERCPPEHAGLGTGTQLGLAVAKAIACELGYGDWPAVELARRVGRGERSAVGVHGFDRGGFVVEAGKLPGEDVSPLLARAEFPAVWRVVLLTPEAGDSWHGPRERSAFAAPGRSPADDLRRLALDVMLPALAAGDCAAFGDALYEYNALAGGPFAAAQGGTYASAGVADLVARLRALGVRGAGQSSWGPTVFGVVADADRAADVLRRVGGGNAAAARNRAAACEVSG